jgi:hypothetical protein
MGLYDTSSKNFFSKTFSSKDTSFKMTLLLKIYYQKLFDQKQNELCQKIFSEQFACFFLLFSLEEEFC